MKAILFLLTILSVTSSLAQDSLTSKINNLVLSPEQKTGKWGELGKVKISGNGKIPLIIIPGWGFGEEVFENFTKDNIEDYKIYTITLAGFSSTPCPPLPDSISYENYYWIRGAEKGILDLIEKEKLEKPVILAHFSVATQIALDLAIEHSDKIGKVIIMSGVPYRYYRPFEDTLWGNEARFTAEQRTKIVDQYWAPSWYKELSEETWDSGNHSPSEYSKDTIKGKQLFEISAQVPVPVMIRYLLEFFCYDASPKYKEIKVPVLFLLPSFSKSFLNGEYCTLNQTSSREWMKYYYLESWNSAREAENPNFKFVTVPSTHVFLWYDNPKQTYKEIRKFVFNSK